MLLAEAVQNAATRDWARVIVSGETIPQAILMVEFFGDSQDESDNRAERFIAASQRDLSKSKHRLLSSPADQKKAWDVRRLALGLVSNIPGKAKSIALIEDACIPIDRLPEYNQFVFELAGRMGLSMSTYAHASVGVLHYKAMLDLHESDGRKKMRELAEACFEKCLAVGGVFSGEHGDGIVRGEFLRRQFGPEVYSAFVGVKQLFDPDGILNPGRKIDAPPLDRLLRFGDSEAERQRYLRNTENPKSRFRYGEHGNLVGAIEQCNGVGACRQILRGTMCPSYRATMDERDSTRGRANLLRLAISGQLDPPGLANPDLHAALDLCLACKACKSECPNAVDMARLKSEALQARWEAHGSSRQARFIASMPQRLSPLVALGLGRSLAGNHARASPCARSPIRHRSSPSVTAAGAAFVRCLVAAKPTPRSGGVGPGSRFSSTLGIVIWSPTWQGPWSSYCGPAAIASKCRRHLTACGLGYRSACSMKPVDLAGRFSPRSTNLQIHRRRFYASSLRKPRR